MNPRACAVISLLPVWLLAAGSAPAVSSPTASRDALSEPPSSSKEWAELTVIERKRPSLWHRPEKATPSEQLAYARSLRDAGRLSAAASAFDDLVHEWHESPEAPEAQAARAALLEQQGSYESAFAEYDYLTRHYTRGYKYTDAVEAQFRIANSTMTSPQHILWFIEVAPDRDRALLMFERLLKAAPRWAGAPQARLNVGLIREAQDEPELAVLAYESLRLFHPDSPLAADADFRQGQCLARLARESPREEKRSLVARSHLQRFLRDRPGDPRAADTRASLAEVSERLSEAAHARAVFYDRRSGSARAALLAYEDFLNKFPESARADSVRRRVEELKVKAEPPSSPGPAAPAPVRAQSPPSEGR